MRTFFELFLGGWFVWFGWLLVLVLVLGGLGVTVREVDDAET